MRGGAQAAAAAAQPAAPLELSVLDGLELDAFVQGYAKYVRYESLIDERRGRKMRAKGRRHGCVRGARAPANNTQINTNNTNNKVPAALRDQLQGCTRAQLLKFAQGLEFQATQATARTAALLEAADDDDAGGGDDAMAPEVEAAGAALRVTAGLASELLAVAHDAPPEPLKAAAQLLHDNALLVRSPSSFCLGFFCRRACA
jgi:hypothetical protein